MRIPFDIKYRPQIESGEYKVETRDGRLARIICWDANCYTPIVFLATEYDDLDDMDREYPYSCNNFGRNFSVNHPNDLFIVTPEEELTEFEKELESFYNHHLQVCSYDNQGTVEDSLHDGASKLLALARKELLSEKMFIEQTYNPDINKAHELGRKEGIMLGKAEALKDLPRWKKWGNGACGNGIGIPIAIVKRELGNYKLVDSLGIQDEQYIMLSDLEKLPGFKED